MLLMTIYRGMNTEYKEHFEEIKVTPIEGGRVVISNYTTLSGTGDIGSKSSINPHGLGGSEWIRNQADIDNHINSIKRTVWLNDEEKEALIQFLEDMKE
jgi:hypothetical protein